MAGPLGGEGVRDFILAQGKSATESTAFFLGNVTQGVQDLGKGGVAIHSGKRIAVGSFKAGKDFARGDSLCATLCCVSVGCETLCTVLVWVPFPGKILTVSSLKTISTGCQKFRDLCAADPSSPFCID